MANKLNPDSKELKTAPPRRQAGVNLEALEERRLMSSAVAPAGHSSDASSGYTFDYNRPALHMMAMPAAVFGADVAAAFGRADVGSKAATIQQPAVPQAANTATSIFAPELEATTGQGDVLTGSYAPRVKFWGHTRISDRLEDEPGVNPFAVTKTQGHSDFPPPPKHLAPPPVRHHALIVEDDLPSRVAMTKILQRRGWDVTAVGTMAEGLRELHDTPEAVILDLSLPDGDGETILQQIRVQHMPTTVAVTTGFGDATRLAHVQELGPDAILAKPVNIAALLQRLPHLPDIAGPALAAA